MNNSLSKKYILYNKLFYETFILKEPLIFFKLLNSNFNWELCDLNDENFKNIKNSNILICGCNLEIMKMKILKDNNNFLILRIADLHPEKPLNILRELTYLSDIIMGHTTYLIKEKKLNDKIPNIFVPPSIIYKMDFNENPINKIFISGKIHKMYPFRTYMYNYAKINPEKFDILNHPNYCNFKHNQIHENYINVLNKYLCCFTCASVYKYIVFKNFEILSSGSLLLTDDSVKNILEELGIIDLKTCILCNQQNIFEKINFILDPNNRKLINEIRLNGKKLVEEFHTVEKRVQYFNEQIEPYLK